MWVPLLIGGVPGVPSFLSGIRNYLYLTLVIFLFSLLKRNIREELKSLYSNQVDSFDIKEKTFKFWKRAILLWGLFAYLKLMIVNTYTYQIVDVDFSYFDLMIANFIRGNGWYSEACQCNHMGVHSTYFFYLLAPFHYLFNSPLLLQVVHGLSLWVAAFPLLKIIEHFKFKKVFSLAFVFTLFNYTAFVHNLKYNFHFEIWYIPIFLWMFYFFEVRKWGLFHLFALLSLLVKEDAGFYLLGYGASLFIFSKERKHSFILISYSIILTIISLKVFIPHHRETSDYVVAGTASVYGSNIKEIALNMLKDPFGVMGYVIKGYWLKFLIPFLFVPFLSASFVVAVAPYVVIHSTAQSDLMAKLMLYYSAPFLPFLLYFFLKKLSSDFSFKNIKLKEKRNYILTFFMVYGALVGSGQIQYREVKPQYISFKSTINDLNLKEKKVCSQGSILPHLGYDSKLTSLRHCDQNLQYDYIFINPQIDPFPFSREVLESKLRAFEGDDNYEVLEKIGSFYIFSSAE